MIVISGTETAITTMKIENTENLPADADTELRRDEPPQFRETSLGRRGPIGQLLERVGGVGRKVIDRRRVPGAGLPADFEMLSGLRGDDLERLGIGKDPGLDAIELLEQPGMARLEHRRRLPGVLLELLNRLLLAGVVLVEHALAGFGQFGLEQVVLGFVFALGPAERLVELFLCRVQIRLELFGDLIFGRGEFFLRRGVTGPKLGLDPLFSSVALGGQPVQLGHERALDRDGKGIGHD